MPAILVSLWDKEDAKTCFFMPYGKNGKKRRKPQPVKLSRWGKLKEIVQRYLEYGKF